MVAKHVMKWMQILFAVIIGLRTAGGIAIVQHLHNPSLLTQSPFCCHDLQIRNVHFKSMHHLVACLPHGYCTWHSMKWRSLFMDCPWGAGERMFISPNRWSMPSIYNVKEYIMKFTPNICESPCVDCWVWAEVEIQILVQLWILLCGWPW